MVTKTTAIAASQPIRRRMNLLGATHSTHALRLNTTGSFTSSDSKGLSGISASEPEDFPTGRNDDRDGSLHSDYETGSDVSDHEQEDATEHLEIPRTRENPKRPHIDTSNLAPPKDRGHPSPMSPNSRAWYEFDLAVVVALVSPIGNWLTGGDHIKNLLLIILLIFYLHQIIEVPWELYKNSRPRRRSPSIAVHNVEDQFKHIASSELRLLEFFFLSLTTISPFLGALLLRYGTAAVMGEEAVSWFSTALFVLATGMRPWSHVVDRFTQRTTDLHDVIHYPSPNRLSADDTHQQIEDMMKRVEDLEKSLTKAKAKLVDATEEVYEYVDEAVNAVERTVRRHERKYDKQELKVKEIEQVVESFKGKGKSPAQPQGLTISTTTKAAQTSLLNNLLPTWLTAPRIRSYPSPPPLSPSASKHSLRTLPSSSSSSLQLETIPEEDVSKYPILAQPANLPSLVLSRAGYLVTLPLRAIVRMILRRY
ncbi:hypothetical protein BDZ94DRAFT_1184174 [Collybia nuda]|uniref:Uncharacterized protein n=1 Tax=Collybia nuda TaxID=64659 RepID=A0A9P5YH01_9AGAR|nr:hypothetical protein BDZ94DRAFT_1184174 [Collybia nuda]